VELPVHRADAEINREVLITTFPSLPFPRLGVAERREMGPLRFHPFDRIGWSEEFVHIPSGDD
jgi:hypothetical protein